MQSPRPLLLPLLVLAVSATTRGLPFYAPAGDYEDDYSAVPVGTMDDYPVPVPEYGLVRLAPEVPRAQAGPEEMLGYLLDQMERREALPEAEIVQPAGLASPSVDRRRQQVGINQLPTKGHPEQAQPTTLLPTSVFSRGQKEFPLYRPGTPEPVRPQWHVSSDISKKKDSLIAELDKLKARN